MIIPYIIIGIGYIVTLIIYILDKRDKNKTKTTV